jgi:hypothetical protein
MRYGQRAPLLHFVAQPPPLGRVIPDALWWAWQHSKGMTVPTVNPARVGAAFRFYMDREGSPFSAENYAQELARRVQSPKFLRDMEGYLPTGRIYDPHLAHLEFGKVFLPHIDASTARAN